MERRAVLEQSNNWRTAETTIKSRQGNQSNSNRTRPLRSSKRIGVRLSETSPPPTFANTRAGTLSPHLTASDISLFGSPSCWISSSQKEPFVGAVAKTNNTSNVHIYAASKSFILLFFHRISFFARGGGQRDCCFKLIFLFLKTNMKIFNSKAFLIGHEAMVK